MNDELTHDMEMEEFFMRLYLLHPMTLQQHSGVSQFRSTVFPRTTSAEIFVQSLSLDIKNVKVELLI